MHQWVLFQSHFDGWRWEERDEHHRIVRESRCGFDEPDDALGDLRLVLRAEYPQGLRKTG
jgi:hypothetical protein